MPKELLEQIEKEAAAESRTRSNWIVTELKAVVALRKKLRKEKDFGEAGEFWGVDASGSFSGTTRVSPAPFSPPQEPGSNEAEPEFRKNLMGPRLKSTRPGIKKITEGKEEQK
jgi:hypothetical protein